MDNAKYMAFNKPINSWHVYRAFVGLGILCGIIIVSVYNITKPIIKMNKDALLQQAIKRVLPTAHNFATFIQQESGVFIPRHNDLNTARAVHVGYDVDKKMVGFAIEAKGMGYQDAIHVLYGYVLQEQIISGYEILQSRETPGLGTRISTDITFMNQFKRLDVSLDASQTRINFPIDYIRKRRREKEDRQMQYLDTITGATVSSRALIKIIGRSSSRWMPLIAKHKQDFM